MSAYRDHTAQPEMIEENVELITTNLKSAVARV